MDRLWRRKDGSDIERRLRRDRPQAPDDLVRTLSSRIEAEATRGSGGSFRVALAAGLTVLMLIATAAVGGLSYASSAARHTAGAVGGLVVSGPKHPPSAAPRRVSGGHGPSDDQYGTKITLCHKPGRHQQTIRVSRNAVAAHLRHGDYVGSCRPLRKKHSRHHHHPAKPSKTSKPSKH